MHPLKNPRLAAGLVVLTILASACAPAAPTAAPTPLPPEATPTPIAITLTDGLGRAVTLDQPARRIASLAPSNTEILFALGAGERMVARDTFSDFPDAAKQIPDIGGGFGTIDTEVLVSQQPDLVLAAETNPVENVQQLEGLGLKVFYLANPKELEGMYTNLRLVAQMIGQQEQAEALISNLQARVTAVDAQIARADAKPLVFYELDATDLNAPWTSGPGTFIDLLIARAGGTNMGGVLKEQWAQISVEEIITQNPQIIVLGDYTLGGIQPEDVYARPGWASIQAVKAQQVYPFDDNLVSRPGPRLVDGLEGLARLIHPELFQ